ncbi:PAS domain-containing methyl-accepting chemotaxis protein [Vibrio sp. PP-XX7]
MAKRNRTIINQEVAFPETEELVSTTDPRGVITYVNDPFCRVAGYSREELINKNHNIVRHPEMPKEAFKDLWEHLKKGKHGAAQSKTDVKNGQYYWVDALVTPIYQHGQLVGYQSVRRKLAEPIKKRAEKLYASIINNKSSTNSHLKKLFNYSSRLSLAVLCSIFIIACTYWVHPLLSIVLPILFFLFMYRELVTTPQYEQQLKLLYDSISRQIYCEDPANIAEFHLAMNEGRIKTILGRAADSSIELSHKVKELETASQHSTHNVESEAIELEKVSAAMEEMLATTKEIAQNSTQTSEQIHDANDQCAQSIHRMTSTQSLMNKLVHDVDSSSKSTLHLSEQINVNSGINDRYHRYCCSNKLTGIKCSH